MIRIFIQSTSYFTLIYRHYAYILLGHELILEEEFAKAKDAFRKAIKISPNIINAWVGVAQVAMHELNFIEANGIYKKVLAYVPKSQQVIANLGRSYYEIKQYDHAIKCFKKVQIFYYDLQYVKSILGTKN